MQKEELIRVFMEKNRLLTPEALQLLGQKQDINELLKKDLNINI